MADNAAPPLSIIVARDRNGVIGVNNRLPWHISEDLKRFKALTMGHAIIMGRRTFESIGRALPGRLNIVVSRRGEVTLPEGVVRVSSFAQALEAARAASQAFVIGGRELFEHALPLAQRLYVTEVDGEFQGDTFFPPVDSTQWREVAREHRAQAGEGYRGYDFVCFERA